MVVLLRKGVRKVRLNPLRRRRCEPGGQQHAGIRRRGVTPKGLQRVGHGNEPERCFLSAHPLGPAIGWVGLHPVFEQSPEPFDVPSLSIEHPSPD